MSKFISIEYQGSYSELINFLKSKELYFENKQIGVHRVFMKVPTQEVFDEIKFLESDVPLEEGKELRMSSVKEISETEFISTAENGFELINNDHKVVSEGLNAKVNDTPLIQPNIIPNVQPNIPSSVQPKIAICFPQAQGQEAPKTQNLIQECEDPRLRITEALNNTSLPSKSPLPQDDPFVFLSSPSYLRNFIAASTLLLFVLTLFE
jgi:hypothetical protein